VSASLQQGARIEGTPEDDLVFTILAIRVYSRACAESSGRAPFAAERIARTRSTAFASNLRELERGGVAAS